MEICQENIRVIKKNIRRGGWGFEGCGSMKRLSFNNMRDPNIPLLKIFRKKNR